MAGTLEMETEVSIGQWRSKRAEQQVIQLFSNLLYKTHHNLRRFFGYFLSDFITLKEEHRNASDRRAAINAPCFISVHVIKLNCTAPSDKAL